MLDNPALPNAGSSRREFLRLSAATALGVGVLNLGWPGVSSVSAEPKEVGGVAVDDWPLLGPYLLPTVTPADSIRIAFRGTDEKTKSAAGVVRYGRKQVGEQEHGFTANAKHVLDLKGLAPDCEYQYRLDLGDYKSPQYRFRTAPAPGTRTKTLKAGLFFDMHFQEAERLLLPKPTPAMFFRHCASMFGDVRKFGPDLLLLGGDIVDGLIDRKDSLAGQYEMFFRVMRDLLANALVLPCPGNHEWGCGDPDLSVYGDYFPLPQNGPEDDRNNTWSFAYGGIGLQMRADDTTLACKHKFPRARKSAAAWIRQNLAWLKDTCGADTIIDAQHYPIFHWSDGKGGLVPTAFDPNGQAGVTDNFDACGSVRLALSGHTHMHQRTLPLRCENGVRATTTEKADYGPDTKGTIYLQSPSLWRGYPNPVDHPLVACNGKQSFAIDIHGYAGYTEMTISSQDIATETFLYDKFGKACHEKVDSFRVARRL